MRAYKEGYWGYGILEGYNTGELFMEYKDFLYKLDTKHEAIEATKQEVIKRGSTAEEVLVLAYIEMDSCHTLSPDIKELALSTIEVECSPDTLSKWTKPEKRLNCLQDFKEQILKNHLNEKHITR